MKESKTSIIRVEMPEYPCVPPFDPDEPFPEYPFTKRCVSSSPNYVYPGIRQALFCLGFDNINFGAQDWNPLGEFINPGDKVLLKPNFVLHENKSGNSIKSVITHGSVIRAVLDYVIIALKEKGEIFVADAPQYDADFDKIIDVSGTRDVIEALRPRTDIPISLIDLRVEKAVEKDGLVVDRIKLRGDPHGYIPIDLGDKSHINIVSHKKLIRGSDYDGIETIQHHNKSKHEYYIPKTILNADVFINIPKLKTHRKCGVTICLKNLIGINGDKNWIPHFRIGGPRMGGDEHSNHSILRDFECLLKDRFKSFVYHAGPIGLYISRLIRKIQKSVVEHSHLFDIRGGSWYGNDTLWRSILDLNRILLFADKDGKLCNRIQRRYLGIVDGIIGGQGDGPYHTLSADSACIIAGTNPIFIDLAALLFMGFDYKKIPKVFEAIKDGSLLSQNIEDIEFHSNDKYLEEQLYQGKPIYKFTPPFSWKGHIEL